VVESAPQTLVCAVIYASTKDRIDSTTTVHVFVDIDWLPQASKQAYFQQFSRRFCYLEALSERCLEVSQFAWCHVCFWLWATGAFTINTFIVSSCYQTAFAIPRSAMQPGRQQIVRGNAAQRNEWIEEFESTSSPGPVCSRRVTAQIDADELPRVRSNSGRYIDTVPVPNSERSSWW